jgi:hypothetical protein
MNLIIATPPYSHRSDRIRVMNELCTTLIQLGYQASITLITEGSQFSQGFKTATLSRSSEENLSLAITKTSIRASRNPLISFDLNGRLYE